MLLPLQLSTTMEPAHIWMLNNFSQNSIGGTDVSESLLFTEDTTHMYKNQVSYSFFEAPPSIQPILQ
jgi:hypothetical protein